MPGTPETPQAIPGMADALTRDPEQDDAANQQREVERAAVKEWTKRIQNGREIDKKERLRWPKWRRYVQGREITGNENDASEWIVDTRLVQATMQALVPTLYAQDPDVSVTPEEAVSPTQYDYAKKFGQTLEIIISRLLRDASLKDRMRRQIRSGITTPVGWLKVMLQTGKATDPLVEREMNTTQDNLDKVQALLAELKDSPECVEYQVKQAELTDHLTALQARVEVTTVQGLVIDLVAPEDVQADEGLRELVDYEFGRYLAHRSWYTADDAKAEFKLTTEQLKGATRFNGRMDEPGKASQSTEGKTPELLAVWEVQDRATSTYKVFIEGCDFWAREPYAPQPCGFRFYNLFALMFHPVDGERWPMCDVEMWSKLQDEASRRLSAGAEHRRRNIPGVIFDATNITEEDAKRIASGVTQEMIGVTPMNPNQSVSQSFAPKPYAPYDPATYDISDIRYILDSISGVQDATRGTVQKVKTATEASILDQGMDARVQDRRVIVEMMVESLARFVAEILLETMTEQEAVRIAGPGAVWPQLSKDEIYSLVSIRIRAGSTGKPNHKQQQETWAQLLPIISAAIEKVSNLRAEAQGQAAGGNMAMAKQIMALADAQTELLKETLRRTDERIDIDKYLPPPVELQAPTAVPGLPGMPGAPAMPGAGPAAAAVPGAAVTPAPIPPTVQ